MYRSDDPVDKARAENMIYEEQISAQRQQDYAAFPPAGPSRQAWYDSHGKYLERHVYTDSPNTFDAANDLALRPALLTDMAAQQKLVRLESLDYALSSGLFPPLDQLWTQLGQFRSGTPDQQGEARAVLGKLCDSLNNNPHAVRPRFAAFYQDVAAELEHQDWATRLRDRLALPHYPKTTLSGPHPVVLMCYTVEEVVKHARKKGVSTPLAVPTVLDAEPYEVFYPAPAQADYGRTLDLRGNPDGDRLTSEILHLQFPYRPSHILKIGAIGDPSDYMARLTPLREEHLVWLQLHNDRPDFGNVGA